MASDGSPPTVPVRRRRPTKQEYRRRRVVALVVVAVMLAGGVGIVRALNGGAGSTTAAADTSSNSAPAAAGTVDDPAATPVPAPTAAPTVTPTTAGVPTAEHPAKVYIAGDSDAGTFGPYLQRLLKPLGIVGTTLDYTSSTGLARPDFFDWPAHFAAKLAEVDPAIVIVTFGGNDSQGLANSAGRFIYSTPTGGEGNDAEWRAEYARRVGTVMDQLTGNGRTLIWVGIPNDDNADVTARLKVQDEVVRDQVAKHPGVVYVDTWNRFSGRNGGWADYVVDPRDGQAKEVRHSDGFHLNETGAEILALDIAEVVKTDLRRRGAAI